MGRYIWETQQIHIQRNLQRVLRDGKQVRNFSTPKTATSDRKIMVGVKTLEALRAQQKEVRQKRRWRKNGGRKTIWPFLQARTRPRIKATCSSSTRRFRRRQG